MHREVNECTERSLDAQRGHWMHREVTGCTERSLDAQRGHVPTVLKGSMAAQRMWGKVSGCTKDN